MFIKTLILLWVLVCSSPIWSFNCYFTLAKDSCWLKYNVTVDVVDANSAKVLTTVTVPSGQPWARQTFTCQPLQKLMYHAQFTPIIWEAEKDTVYRAKDYWSLPEVINQGDKAWNVSVCFSKDFAAVPLPPEATSKCSCDFASIPIIEPL
ncbi:MAG: hypothetical protein ACHP65_04295 [Legionellales bacterium]